MVRGAQEEPGAKVLTYEEECREQIDGWHAELKELVAKPDSSRLKALEELKAAIDVQLALAELKIKVRQADWAKTMTWGPLILPTLGAILGAFIGGWLKGHS